MIFFLLTTVKNSAGLSVDYSSAYDKDEVYS